MTAMYTALGPEAIGIRGLSLAEAIALTRDAGFEGLVFSPQAVADAVDERGAEAVKADFAAAGIRAAHWNLPVAWRDETRWQDDLAALPRLANAAAAIGATRTATYMPSGSDERPYRENFDWHASRLRAIAEVLADAGCRLGIEYIGPKTFRAAFRHEFIYTLPATLELIDAIGMDNVGLMVDSWHLFASGGSLDDLASLTNDQIVVAHVNDAPAGIPWDEQIDTVRALPMETGVIDLVGFMRTLEAIGYDGSVMPEPFSQRVVDLAARDPMAAAKEAQNAMAALWVAAGLG